MEGGNFSARVAGKLPFGEKIPALIKARCAGLASLAKAESSWGVLGISATLFRQGLRRLGRAAAMGSVAGLLIDTIAD